KSGTCSEPGPDAARGQPEVASIARITISYAFSQFRVLTHRPRQRMVISLRSAMLPESPSRRRFLESAAALPLAAATVRSASAQAPPQGAAPAAGAMPKRAVLISMLPPG